MNKPLARRINFFKSICGSFMHPDPILIKRQIFKCESPEGKELAVAVARYIYETLGTKLSADKLPIAPWEELNEAFEKLVTNREQCPDITPNGLLAPKIETIRSYESVVLAVLALLKLALGDTPLLFIDGAPNVRLKLGIEPNKNLSRPRSTEAPHLDCWAGTSADSINMFIPLAGDTERNTVSLFRVPTTWTEDWTTQRSYHDADEIVSQYEEIKFPELPPPKLGEAILWDSCVLHKTTRISPCGPRLSIDLHFTPEKPSPQSHLSEAEIHRRLDRNLPGLDLAGQKLSHLTKGTNLRVDAHRGEVVKVEAGLHPAGLYWS